MRRVAIIRGLGDATYVWNSTYSRASWFCLLGSFAAADAKGLAYAVAAGYSPYAAVRLLELFQFMVRGKAPRSGALTLERRIAQMRALIARNGWEDLKDRAHPLALPEPS